MDAIELLKADHNRVRGLFHQFKLADESDHRDRMAEVADKLRIELEVHTSIEEELFYPAVADLNADIADIVAEGIEEHRQVKALLRELDELTPEDDAWKAKWTVVIENVEHHAGEEEEEMFPKVRSHTATEWRAELGERLDVRKGELGAPTIEDRIDLTAEQVHDLASEQDIPGRSTMSTDELRATVSPS